MWENLFFYYSWLLLKTYPRFAAIFMAKWKARVYDIPAPNVLLVDRRDTVPSNGAALPSNSAPATMRLLGAKSSKAEHVNMKVKEQASRANAKATIGFSVTTIVEKHAPDGHVFNHCLTKCFATTSYGLQNLNKSFIFLHFGYSLFMGSRLYWFLQLIRSSCLQFRGD